jgi:hypothetical protein
MSLISWLQNRISLGSRPWDGSQTRPTAPRFRPRLEALEDRTLPSTYYAATASDLIADINAANKAGGSNTIVLTAPTASPYILTAVNNTTDGATGLPVISGGSKKKVAADNLTIIGNGNTIGRTTVSGTPRFRLFDVASGASLTLENVTLQNGFASGMGVSADGGGIYNQGTLVLSQVTIQNNDAFGLGSSGAGGGIWSNGSLTLENSTILANVANTLGWDYLAFGGGIYIAGGTANITGSTFGSTFNSYAGNSAQGSLAYGGALYVAAGTVTLSGDTLDYNAAEGSGNQLGDDGYGGALYVAGGSVTLRNCIVQYNAVYNPSNGYYPDYNGGGIFIASGATVYLDSFTYQNTNNNVSDNIEGRYILLS